MSLISKLSRPVTTAFAAVLLVVAMGGTWATSRTATAAPAAQLAPRAPPSASGDQDRIPRRGGKKSVTGKLNLNTATEDQLMMLPSIGPSKAERIVIWRKKNGGFKRIADLRRVKGFGYKTFKRLEPLLDIQGETTLSSR